MSLRSVVFVVFAAFALLACGPSAGQIKTARTAHYRTDASVVFQAAMKGLLSVKHEVAKSDPVTGQAFSVARFYEEDGTYVAKDADGKPLLHGREVVIVFEVKVVPAGDGSFGVEVVPHVQQFRDGFSSLFDIKPDDPQMPGFVSGLVDTIYLDIYDHLKSSVDTGTAPPSSVQPS